MLLNFDFADNGILLKPRQGYVGEAALDVAAGFDIGTSYVGDDNIRTPLGDAHVSGLLYYLDKEGEYQLGECVISFGRAFDYVYSPQNTGHGRVFLTRRQVRVSSTVNQVDDMFWTLFIDSQKEGAAVYNASCSTRWGAIPEVINNAVVPVAFRSKSHTNVKVFNTQSSVRLDVPVFTILNGFVYAFCATNDAPYPFNMTRVFLRQDYDESGDYFALVGDKLHVKSPSLTEACSVGYNMLLDQPYHFPIQTGSTSVKGIIAYAKPASGSGFGDVLFTANTGETIRFANIYTYESGASYQEQWEYKGSGDEEWKVLKTYAAVTNLGQPTYCDVTPEHDVFSVQVKFRKGTDDATTRIGVYPQFKLNQDDLKNLGTEKFNLSTATGMFTFNSMIGLYGVDGAKTTIFFSDIENPGYFPFPHNIDAYDEYVLKVVNYLDSLLVITTTSIYTLTGSGLPSTFVKKKIITNLNISPVDADLIKVIKDQVFFKADDTFFVLKPNSYTGDLTDLKSFEVSKTINTYLKDFKGSTLKLLNDVYPPRLTEQTLIDAPVTNTSTYTDLTVTGYNQYVIDGKLQIVVQVEAVCDDLPDALGVEVLKSKLDVIVTYDTMTKQWFFHAQSLLSTAANRHRRLDNQTVLYFDAAIKGGRKHLIVVKQGTTPEEGYSFTLADGSTLAKKPQFPNWQYLDTGVMGLSNTYYKRLRELQFTVDNKSDDDLKFYATVHADGVNVVDNVSYELAHNLIEASAGYGNIYYTIVDAPNLTYPSPTRLGYWALEFSKFPGITLLRTHLALKGKGRFITAQFINRDEKEYELSDIVMVYRQMHSR